jgi:hypothetical protein
MTELSNGLQAVIDNFKEVEHSPEGVNIEQAELLKLLEIMRTLRSLATNLELEVRCLRDMEVGRLAASFVEEEATAFLSDLLPAVDGNIVTPVFGRRS